MTNSIKIQSAWRPVAFTLRLALSPFLMAAVLCFFCFCGIIFAPAGLLWVISVAWVVCFKWVFKLLGIPDPSDAADLEELSYGVFVLMFLITSDFVKHVQL